MDPLPQMLDAVGKWAAGEGAASGAQSVERATRLLGLVGREAERGIALSQIVSASGLNKPTARRLLVALMRARLVEQDEASRRYFLGAEVYVLGLLASRRHSFLDLAMENVRALSAASGDTGFVSMRRDAYAVCLHREEGSHPVRTHALQAGDQHPLGVGAGSLAILAALPDAEVDDILARNAEILATRYPSYDRRILTTAVAETRANGIALNPGLVVSNSWGIGRVVLFPDGRVAGALSLAAVDARLQPGRRAEMAALLGVECGKVEDKLARLFSTGRRESQTRPPRPLPTPVRFIKEKTHA